MIGRSCRFRNGHRRRRDRWRERVAPAAGIETFAGRLFGQGGEPVLRLCDAGRDAELADREILVDEELHARRRQERVALAARVLGQVLLQLADERAFVGDELLPVGGERYTEYSFGT